jgi:hypothetical protein
LPEEGHHQPLTTASTYHHHCPPQLISPSQTTTFASNTHLPTTLPPFYISASLKLKPLTVFSPNYAKQLLNWPIMSLPPGSGIDMEDKEEMWAIDTSTAVH